MSGAMFVPGRDVQPGDRIVYLADGYYFHVDHIEASATTLGPARRAVNPHGHGMTLFDDQPYQVIR